MASKSPGRASGGATSRRPDSRFCLSERHFAAKVLKRPFNLSYEEINDCIYPLYIWSISPPSKSSASSPASLQNRYSATLLGLNSADCSSFFDSVYFWPGASYYYFSCCLKYSALENGFRGRDLKRKSSMLEWIVQRAMQKCCSSKTTGTYSNIPSLNFLILYF